MFEIYISNEYRATVETIEQAHGWLIEHGICDDHVFHVVDTNTGKWVSHHHNGQLYR